MNAPLCIGCDTETGLRLFPQSPLASHVGLTCVCAVCYGTEPDEPKFENLPPLPHGLTAAIACLGRETSPEAQASGAFKEGLKMNVKPFDNLEYALKATASLSGYERIALARKLCLSVDSHDCADALSVASLEILTHAENLSAGTPQLRSDGSVISPYAPSGGPLRPRIEVVS